MYHYFYNAADEDVDRYLKLLTLYSLDEISAIVEEHLSYPEKRLGQQKLAEGIMQILYGNDADTFSQFYHFKKRDLAECQAVIDQKCYPQIHTIQNTELIDILVQI